MDRRVIKTLSYSDIFEYPLTLRQLHKYLITPNKIGIHEAMDLVKKENKYIRNKNGFYFLTGREDNVLLRQQREKESIKKINYARKKTKVLNFIPGIKFLGISGSLSMKNADPNDDIDLFIISSRKQAWTTRLVSVCLLKIQGVYRSKNEKNPSNKLCLNMIIDEDNLLFSKSRQDIYSAHEIVQVLPLFDRENTFIKFVNTNNWIKKYLANFEPKLFRNEKTNIFTNIVWKMLMILKFESLSKFIQLKYMKKKKGRETIAQGFLAFHPNDPRNQIIKAYQTRLKSIKSSTRGY